MFLYFGVHFPKYLNPPTWAQLQTNCALPYDTFDLAWRLVRLDHGIAIEDTYAWQGPSTLIWCFDEVQTAFENQIGENFLDRMCFNIRVVVNEKLVLSGTALRLSNLRKMVDKWAIPYSETCAQMPDRDEFVMAYSMITEHPRINNFSPFWELYCQHMEGILTESRAIQQKYPDFRSMGEFPLRTRSGCPLGFDVDFSNMEALTLLQQINKHQNGSRLPNHWVNLVDIRTALQYYCPLFFWEISVVNSIHRGHPETSSRFDSNAVLCLSSPFKPPQKMLLKRPKKLCEPNSFASKINHGPRTWIGWQSELRYIAYPVSSRTLLRN